MNVRPRPEAGTRFGRLVVIGPAPNRGSNRASLCACDCGKMTTAVNSQLAHGRTMSCGCSRVGACGPKPRHGHHPRGRPSPEWNAWNAMRDRCSNSDRDDWPRYGGRGIRVCDRWESFENFLADMGMRPSARHSLDRIKVNGDYEPSNCRWATPAEQQQNRSNNKVSWQLVQEIRGRYEHGESKTSIARRLGLGQGNVGRIVRNLTWKEGADGRPIP